MDCGSFDLDRPDDPAAARHLADCASCRTEAEARSRLRRALTGIISPAPAELRNRIRQALANEPDATTRRGWHTWVSAAAAILVVVAVFLSTPTPSSSLPELVELSSRFHDRVIEWTPEELQKHFKDQLGLEVLPAPGGCSCELSEKEVASPWVLYRVHGEPLSLLVMESRLPSLPARARRTHLQRDYYVLRCGANTVLACQSGPLCHLWVSRLDESRMLAALLETPSGRATFSGERLTLRGAT